MKRYISIFTITLAFFLLASSLSGCFDESKTQLEGIEIQQVSDGEYEGKCDAGIVYAKVLVRVRNNAVTEIEILEHRKGLGGPAEVIVDDVIKAQSLKVDAVTGATASSKTILKAIENALKKGAKEVIER